MQDTVSASQQTCGSALHDDIHSPRQLPRPLPPFNDEETSSAKQHPQPITIPLSTFSPPSLDLLIALVRQHNPNRSINFLPSPLVVNESSISSSTDSATRQGPVSSACEVCFSRLPASLRTCRSCNVNTCTDCFSSWLEVRILTGHIASLTCVKCREPVSLHEVRAVCGDRLYRKYLYFLSKEQHKDDPRAAWCPRDGCWRALMDVQAHLPSSACELSCPDCQADICAKCFSFSHQGQKCPTPRFNFRHRTLAHFWQRFHTKKCPSCSVRIQRAGGCTQMRCTGCRTKFCWRCKGILHFPVVSEYGSVIGNSAHSSNNANANTNARGRRTHMCICPRITEACVIVSLAGGALIAIPLALAAAVIAGPPAVITWLVLPKEKKEQTRADVRAFIERL